MEINLIDNKFFEDGAVPPKMYREALKKGRNVGMNLTINGNQYKVYVPELFNILYAKEIPLKDGRVIDGTIYVQDYINGYNSGIEYFKKEFPEIHLVSNADLYFSSLHHCYFHDAPNFNHGRGWNYWINSYPISLNPNEIERYGFCAGIEFCLNHIKRKNPILFKKIEKCEHSLQNQQSDTKTNKLKAELEKYGFFELPKVQQLSETSKQRIIELICTNGLPYGIAMFGFLDFLKHLEKEHFSAKYKLNKVISEWFKSDNEGRAVKGNISSLSEYSKENKSKYTAHLHKETVKTDYQKLK